MLEIDEQTICGKKYQIYRKRISRKKFFQYRSTSFITSIRRSITATLFFFLFHEDYYDTRRAAPGEIRRGFETNAEMAWRNRGFS